MSDLVVAYADIPALGLGPWADNLQPASWRGLPFAVRQSNIRRGRKVAVHEYPFRDEVWVEDLGRAARSISFTGFLVGDDVFDQRDAMVAATEEPGPGYLVHPSLGALQANLIEFSAGERAELGRVVEIEFSFIDTGQDQPLFPTADASTQDAVDTSADDADAAAQSDFGTDMADALDLGASVVSAAVDTVAGFAAVATEAVGDAALITDAVHGLVGNFGRYANGGMTALQPAIITAPIALANAVAAGVSVANDAAATIGLAAAL